MYSSATSFISCVLLTGPPGIGKTTVCMNIASILEKQNRTLDGFYTEEVRGVNGSRIGFDIVIIKDKEKRIPLARTELSQQEFSKHRIGNYHVFVDNFEKFVLPVIKTDTDILLIDEIGKMEMCSKKFHDEIYNIFFNSPNKKTFIIATIPQKHKIPRFPVIFQKLHEDKRFKIINVNLANRNNLPNEIVSMLS
ncbi:PREDICTED: cancer-related nucleoside-triphosphatase [Polistes canadensis]|uniref:cancer-related nucleoside-triphosphatase n=1 Tax=Polistes canadensis TaxID=91411 RepID=UPI000718D5AC|nr:PREDICTED: cancer-related nucleoside-triphosphatase [Polistes canadensis]